MIRNLKPVKRLSLWYFRKNILPYWVILLMDTAIVFVSALFTYWVVNRTLITFENRYALLYTALMYALLSWVGARIFKTYSGVLRYSSTVDMAKLAYANLTTFLLATILTFMLLAAILNSLIHPFTIATSIITSFAGVFILLFLSGASTNVGAMLAFVMLVGLVVNNNILVLEPTIARIRRGQNLKVALWTELNAKKNMVLMTSIAVMAGMLPQLWSADGMKSAMAAVMIGGMLASLIWTFTLTPALFFALERLRQKLKEKK